MPQLDALRAFAVLAVLVQHFYFGALRNYVPFGHAGVRLFFVLSGFLITGILLKCRRTAEAEGKPAGLLLEQFYARRFLRIFPPYYLLLALVAAFGLESMRRVGWHALYLSNVLFSIEGHDGPVSHFWTLAVEEQFYLAWPWVVLFAPRRVLLPTVAGAIAAAPLFRLVSLLAGWNFTVGSALPFACLDTLGMGAALALASEPGARPPVTAERLCKAGLWAGVPSVLFMTWVYGRYGSGRLHLLGPRVYYVGADLSLALLCTWLVGRAAVGFRGIAGRVLEWAPLRYLGRISYGVYLYHLLCPRMLDALAWSGHAPWTHPAVRFAVLTAMSFTLAAVSWHAFEAPINRLKRFFEYGASRPGARPPAISTPARTAAFRVRHP